VRWAGKRRDDCDRSRRDAEPAAEAFLSAAPPTVAIVLPPREGFVAGRVGAIGLLVHAAARAPSRFTPVVLGAVAGETFADVPFRRIRLAWRPAPITDRYAVGAVAVLRRHPPALIEVHNRIEVALRLARRFPAIPVCLLLHNDPQQMRGAGTPEERASVIARLASIATCSTWLHQRLLEGVARPARVPLVVPNWLDLQAIPPSPVEREKVLLFAGRVVADKGADTFVRAAARALPKLPGWSARMIGGDRFSADASETSFMRALRWEADAAGIAMLGYRPHADVLAAMARAAIVVVPSRWPEPFGLTALEAMAAGAALLASDRGGLADVTDGATVTIDPDDPPALAEAMVRLAGDPGRRAALSAAGRARAAAYDIAHAIARLDALRADALATWQRSGGSPI
jgi:glycosyltransferase involved in cell wall biosynthesis